MLTAIANFKNCLLRLLPALVLAATALPAAADVWGFIDAQGAAHFATEKLDGRYELFFKNGESFSTEKNQLRPQKPADKNGSGANAAPVARTQAPTRLLAYFDVSPNYKAVKHLLKDASRTHGIDYELLQALIATESGFDTFAVSPKGAVGLMQLMPPTAERYGVKADKSAPIEKKLTDPKTNIKAGATYLRDLIKMFPGQLELALAAYNAGEGAVKRAGNKVPNYPETKNYVKTVMQLYGSLKPPAPVQQAVKEVVHQPVQEASKTPGRVRMVMVAGSGGRHNIPPLIAELSAEQRMPGELKAEAD